MNLYAGVFGLCVLAILLARKGFLFLRDWLSKRKVKSLQDEINDLCRRLKRKAPDVRNFTSADRREWEMKLKFDKIVKGLFTVLK